MNYFMSDIHGAADAYFKMKDKINFKANDNLYIIGDIFDGNPANPEDCLTILDDIMNNDNIQLILGDHEYAHVMYHASEDEDEAHDLWRQHLNSPEMQGTALLHYMEEYLSERERQKYISFLISCEMSELIKIGKKYIYLIHGSPMICRNGDVFAWQKNIAITPTDIEKNYYMAISGDPDIKAPSDLLNSNLMTISGHIHTKHYFENYRSLMHKFYGNANLPTNENPKTQKVLIYNKKMLIDCGCSQIGINTVHNGWRNNLACVAIDSAGFYVEYLINEEEK